MAIAESDLITPVQKNILTLLRDQTDLQWKSQANCLGVDPGLFFPESGEATSEAKEVCRSCVVREECLEFALGNSQRWGIWGGLSERERRRLRQKRVLQKHRITKAPGNATAKRDKADPISLQLLRILAEGEISTAPDRMAVRLVADWLEVTSLKMAQTIANLKAGGLVGSDGRKGCVTSRLWITDAGQKWLETQERVAEKPSRGDPAELAAFGPKAPKNQSGGQEKTEDAALIAAFEVEFHWNTYCDTAVRSSVIHGFTMYTTGQCDCAVCSQAYQDYLDAPKRKAAIRAAAEAGTLPVRARAPKLTKQERLRLIRAGRARLANEERWAATVPKLTDSARL